MAIQIEDLKKMSKKEVIELQAQIKKELEEAAKKYNYFNMMQLAYKLVLNGVYGFFSNKNSSMSNFEIANAVTGMGRDCIQYMLKCIENYFFNEWHNDVETHKLIGTEYIGRIGNEWFLFNKNFEKITYPYNSLEKLTDKLKIINFTKSDIVRDDIQDIYIHHICDFDKVERLDSDPKFEKDVDGVLSYVGENPLIIYSDTDSVDKSTLIKVKNDKISVEDFYNRNIKNGSAGSTIKGHESVKCDEKVLNYSKEKGLYYADVERIIRHKVTKEKWCLKTKSGKEIYITNDHSLVVFRDGEKISIKPKDVLKTDKILIVNKKIKS